MSEAPNHGRRIEDIGLGRLTKLWPFIIAIFTAGAWYQTQKVNAAMSELIQRKVDDHEARIIRVEDAVLFLKQIVEHEHHPGR